MSFRKNLLYVALFVFFMSFVASCTPFSRDTRFESIQNELQLLINTKQMVLCGTVDQFQIPPQDMSHFSSYQLADFVCSDEIPYLQTRFATARIYITGNIPMNENWDRFQANTIDPFYTENPISDDGRYYRGYIKTYNAHFEGIFYFDSSSDKATFTIANSALERSNINDE